MPELAEHFEVSKRTILRDIDDLSRAGIPICTTQGAGCGIRIMDGYRMDRTVLSSKELQMILAGLRSLDSVSGSRCYQQLMEKIKAGSSVFVSGNDTILIDLSAWNKESISEKIMRIQTSIDERRAICFRYYSPKAETLRTVDPYYLIFKWGSWYVWAFCRKNREFRMFKLNRMDQLNITNEPFPVREVPFPQFDTKTFFPADTHLKAVFDASMKWHLLENYGSSSFSVQEDGSLLFEADLDEAGVITWLLSCGDKVTVLEPQPVKDKLYRIASLIADKYEDRNAGDSK